MSKFLSSPKGSAQLLVIHVGLVLPGAPELRHDLRVLQLELSLVADPVDDFTMVFLGQEFKSRNIDENVKLCQDAVLNLILQLKSTLK